MSTDGDSPKFDGGAEKLKEALRDHAGFAVERMPGLGRALEQFVVAAQRHLTPLSRLSGVGTIEPARSTTLFQAIGDCSGLTAAIYASSEPEARLLIALDERIDDLIVTSVFGESGAPGVEDESPGRRASVANSDRNGTCRGVRTRAWTRARSGFRAPCGAVDRLRMPRHTERRLRAWTARHAGRCGAIFAADERGRL